MDQTWSTEYTGRLPFNISLFYPSQGILALYSVQAELVGDQVQACPANAIRPVIGLWSQDRDITYEEALKVFRQYFGSLEIPIEDATGMDVLSFAEAIKNPDICVQSPADYGLRNESPFVCWNLTNSIKKDE